MRILTEFNVFDDMGGLFEARLKDVKTVVRSSRLREGEVTLSSQLATIEARFVYKVFDKLHNPCFIDEGVFNALCDGSDSRV